MSDDVKLKYKRVGELYQGSITKPHSYVKANDVG